MSHKLPMKSSKNFLIFESDDGVLSKKIASVELSQIIAITGSCFTSSVHTATHIYHANHDIIDMLEASGHIGTIEVKNMREHDLLLNKGK